MGHPVWFYPVAYLGFPKGAIPLLSPPTSIRLAVSASLRHDNGATLTHVEAGVRLVLSCCNKRWLVQVIKESSYYSLLDWGIREVTQDRIEFSSFLILFYLYIHNRNRKLYSNYDSNNSN